MSATKSPRRRQADAGMDSDQQHDNSLRITGNALAIDTRFVTCLFEPDDLMEVRLLPSKRQTFARAGQLLGSDADLQAANDAGENIYIGANPRRQNGGKAVDVALARCLFVDIDGTAVDEARRRIRESGVPQPTIEVASGHGLHAYWRLTEPMQDLAAWTAAQKQLIGLLRSDSKVHDAPRIMRLPTFRNHKPPVAVCEVVDADPSRRYALADILSAIQHVLSETPTVTESTEMTSVCSADSAYSVTLSPDEIATLCIPKRVGERNGCIWMLARGLKADAGLAARPLSELKAIVKEWHQQALPIIGTKPFDESWCDFVRAWETAMIPLKSDPIAGGWMLTQQQTASGGLPACAAEYDSVPVRMLVGLCRNLAVLRPDRHFFLSCHAAARLLAAKPMQVHRWLAMLAADGVLSVVKVGNERRATRYEYIGGD